MRTVQKKFSVQNFKNRAKKVTPFLDVSCKNKVLAKKNVWKFFLHGRVKKIRAKTESGVRDSMHY